MRITVNRLALQSSLAIAAGIAARRTTLPMLGNVLLHANGKLNLTATDLQIAYASSVPCDADSEATVALPAKMLLDAVSSMSDKELRVDVEGTNVELRAGKSRFKITGLDPKDFPKQMNVSKMSFAQVPLKELRFLIDTVEHACNDKTQQPHLQGISINLAEGIATASDGNQCALARRALGVTDLGIVHAPKDALRHMLRAFEHHDAVGIAANKSEMYFHSGETLFGVKLFEVPFPHSHVVSFIRKQSQHSITCPRKPLIETLKRVGLVSNSDHGLPVNCVFSDGNFNLKATGTGEAEDDIECDYKGKGIKFKIASRFLVGVLEAITTDDVQIGVQDDDLLPIYIGPVGADDHDFVIMGMR